ncbi:hypothetical protein SM109_002041 [Cronobacter sakazakii]|nr:hypothetical protein [Cronobacter sakazakii]
MIINKLGKIYEDDNGKIQIEDFSLSVSNPSELTEENVMRGIISYILRKSKLDDESAFNFFAERTVALAIQKAARKDG